MKLLNEERLEEMLKQYPQLAIALCAGVVSVKMARELIDVDRWYMSDLYKELIKCGAVEGTSSSCFKATKEAREYIKARRDD